MRTWLAKLPLGELVDRYCHYEREPWGWEVDNFRSGVIASTIAQVHGNKASASDFYPVTEPEPEQSDDEVAAFFRSWCE